MSSISQKTTKAQIGHSQGTEALTQKEGFVKLLFYIIKNGGYALI